MPGHCTNKYTGICIPVVGIVNYIQCNLNYPNTSDYSHPVSTHTPAISITVGKAGFG